MDRRNFLRTMGTAAAAAAVSETGLNAGSMFKDGKGKASSRKEEGLRVRFLGTQAELDASLPTPLRAAYDGLEVYFPILPQV